MDVNQLMKSTQVQKKESQETLKIKSEDESFNNVMNSISQNWKEKPSDEVTKLKRELEQAKSKLQELGHQKLSLTKNEEKILSAIKSESINQKTDTPIISYNKFRKLYKVSSDYYRPSINSLLEKEIISQTEATFSGSVKTYSWKMLTKE